MKQKTLFLASLLLLITLCSIAYAQDTDNAGKELSEMDLDKVIKQNLDNVDLENVPKVVRFILGKPKINIELKLNDGSTKTFGFKIAGNRIKDFQPGGLDKPHYIIEIKENSLKKIIASKDPAAKTGELYETGEIEIKPQKVGSKVKYFVANKFRKWFGK
ncbi:hypothetical protein ACFL0W_03395 [Nanoarchaeota archaeon]